MKETLKKEQPIVYQILDNEFHNDKRPHAFLIVGKNHKDLLCFLTQSILCKESVACEMCNVCLRVKRNIYPDVIRISGKDSSIKKKDIENIQIQMAKSSIEGRGKIYIIEEIENSSKEAINSILKMLEEPLENVYAIFTTSNLDRVLPTVISRCQVLKLNPNNRFAIERLYLENNFSKEDAYILARIFNDFVIVDNYSILKEECNNFINDLFFKKDNLVINTQINVINKYNKKEDIKLFLNILIIFLRDLYQFSFTSKSDIGFIIDMNGKFDARNNSIILKQIEMLLDVQYQLESNVNINLLMDKMMYQLLQVND